MRIEKEVCRVFHLLRGCKFCGRKAGERDIGIAGPPQKAGGDACLREFLENQEASCRSVERRGNLGRDPGSTPTEGSSAMIKGLRR